MVRRPDRGPGSLKPKGTVLIREIPARSVPNDGWVSNQSVRLDNVLLMIVAGSWVWSERPESRMALSNDDNQRKMQSKFRQTSTAPDGTRWRPKPGRRAAVRGNARGITRCRFQLRYPFQLANRVGRMGSRRRLEAEIKTFALSKSHCC